jgi:hypothetical protein
VNIAHRTGRRRAPLAYKPPHARSFRICDVRVGEPERQGIGECLPRCLAVDMSEEQQRIRPSAIPPLVAPNTQLSATSSAGSPAGAPMIVASRAGCPPLLKRRITRPLPRSTISEARPAAITRTGWGVQGGGDRAPDRHSFGWLVDLVP